MFSNMASSLLMHEKVETTLPKAKELRRVVERVIADAKNNRYIEVRRVIKDKVVYHKVFDVLAPRYKERPGGFTRILKLGARKGDAAEVALVKLV
jgi:large subunit ribosomal protein L17